MKCEKMFTDTDYAIIRSAVRQLPSLLGTVVDLRFWKEMDTAEIASALGITIRSTEALLVRAFQMLREYCLRHPAFSRSKYWMLKLMESQSVA